jgi:hypothetical protein
LTLVSTSVIPSAAASASFGDGEERIELERLYLGEADRFTDLRFRVVKSRSAAAPT